MDTEEINARKARAEARKRKILLNSENRLLKLSGRSATKLESCETDQQSEAERKQQEDLLVTYALNSHDNSEPTVIHQVSQESSVRNRVHSDSTVHDGTVRLNKNTITSSESVIERKSHEHESHNEQGPAAKTADDVLAQRIARVRLLSCAAAAILAKILLNIGIGVLFLKDDDLPVIAVKYFSVEESLVVVFVMLQIALFRYQTSQLQGASLAHKSSMLSSALVLCGIPQYLISIYSQIMSVIEEFTFYTFTFILVHVIL